LIATHRVCASGDDAATGGMEVSQFRSRPGRPASDVLQVLHDRVHGRARILVLYSCAAFQPESIRERCFDAQQQLFGDLVICLRIAIQVLSLNPPDNVSAFLEGSIRSLEME
jgi:hypothetical protein